MRRPIVCFVSDYVGLLGDDAAEDQVEGNRVVIVFAVGDHHTDGDDIVGVVIGEGENDVVQVAAREGTGLGRGVVGVGVVHLLDFLDGVAVAVVNNIEADNVLGESEVCVSGVEVEAEFDVQVDAFEAVAEVFVDHIGDEFVIELSLFRLKRVPGHRGRQRIAADRLDALPGRAHLVQHVAGGVMRLSSE